MRSSSAVAPSQPRTTCALLFPRRRRPQQAAGVRPWAAQGAPIAPYRNVAVPSRFPRWGCSGRCCCCCYFGPEQTRRAPPGATPPARWRAAPAERRRQPLPAAPAAGPRQHARRRQGGRPSRALKAVTIIALDVARPPHDHGRRLPRLWDELRHVAGSVAAALLRQRGGLMVAGCDIGAAHQLIMKRLRLLHTGSSKLRRHGASRILPIESSSVLGEHAIQALRVHLA